MSVIIKGMAMPETCYECRFCEEQSEYPFNQYCVAHLNLIENQRRGRLDTCPLEDAEKKIKEAADDAYWLGVAQTAGFDTIEEAEKLWNTRKEERILAEIFNIPNK